MLASDAAISGLATPVGAAMAGATLAPASETAKASRKNTALNMRSPPTAQ
jgi:hypothetical protein